MKDSYIKDIMWEILNKHDECDCYVDLVEPHTDYCDIMQMVYNGGSDYQFCETCPNLIHSQHCYRLRHYCK